MIPITINQRTCFFSIVHVTKQSPDKLIYGILINPGSYYLSKTIGIEDCVQLDSKTALEKFADKTANIRNHTVRRLSISKLKNTGNV